MEGPLNVEQQYRILALIWGRDRDEGFVFLPWIPGTAKDKKERRAGYHEGPAFPWPAKDNGARIKKWLADHTDDEMYFSASVFVDKHRTEQAADIERCLWADLDEVDPQSVPQALKPTIAWESSPGRFQGVWLLDRAWEGASWPGRVNHRLTVHLGADPSGWDTTQLLRVPGRPNHKWEYKEKNNGQPVPGRLLWEHGPRYTRDDFEDLPDVVVTDMTDTDLMDASVIDAIDRHEVWGRVRMKVSTLVREYMAFRRASQITEEMDRSEIQWQIMCDLAAAGCNVAEIVAIVRPTLWNSYAGRSDELKRLKVGAAKAVQKYRDDEKDGDGGALEELGDDKPPLRWLSEVMSVRMRRPRWLVHNVLSEQSCGFIAGDPKSYKSWMALDLAVTMATGGAFLNDPGLSTVGGAKPILYLQEEDSELVVRERLDNIIEGKCPDRHWNGRVTMNDGALWWEPSTRDIPMGFYVRTGFVASDPGWQAWLADVIAEGAFAGTIIDTLGTTAGSVDTDRAQELMSKILRPMRQISHQTNSSIVIVHHNKKGNGGDNLRGGQRMLGSVALHAWVDDALYVHSREKAKDGNVKVRVERESKQAVEDRWVVEVPWMGERPDGTRAVWAPTTGVWDDQNATKVTGDHDVAPTPAKRNGGRPAGTQMMYYVKRMNGTEQRPIPVERIAEINAMTMRNAKKQVEQALANQLIAGSVDGGVWVP